MQVEQTNGTDTATFERTPLVKGGQGRTADDLTDPLAVCGWLMLAVVQLGAVIGGIGVIDAVAGHLVAGIAALCCVVVGINAYGFGRAG